MYIKGGELGPKLLDLIFQSSIFTRNFTDTFQWYSYQIISPYERVLNKVKTKIFSQYQILARRCQDISERVSCHCLNKLVNISGIYIFSFLQWMSVLFQSRSFAFNCNTLPESTDRQRSLVSVAFCHQMTIILKYQFLCCITTFKVRKYFFS